MASKRSLDELTLKISFSGDAEDCTEIMEAVVETVVPAKNFLTQHSNE